MINFSIFKVNGGSISRLAVMEKISFMVEKQ